MMSNISTSMFLVAHFHTTVTGLVNTSATQLFTIAFGAYTLVEMWLTFMGTGDKARNTNLRALYCTL